MSNTVILHGTDGSPESNWFPWLKERVEAEGYEVWVPQLPDSHTPNRDTYAEFLFNSDIDFSNSILIGHSSGAVEVLNMLMDDRCPHVKLAVCVSAWDHGVPEGMDANQFAGLFPKDGFDFEIIKNKVDRIEFVHADNDPYCPLEQAEYLADKTGGRLTVIPNGIHLGSNYTEFPELWEIIQR